MLRQLKVILVIVCLWIGLPVYALVATYIAQLVLSSFEAMVGSVLLMSLVAGVLQSISLKKQEIRRVGAYYRHDPASLRAEFGDRTKDTD